MGENNNFSKAKISIRNFDLFYGNFQALHSIDMDIPENKIWDYYVESLDEIKKHILSGDFRIIKPNFCKNKDVADATAF